jgi:hypothetical protein
VYFWDPFSAWGPEGPRRFDPEVLLKLSLAVLLGLALLHYGFRYPLLLSAIFVIVIVLVIAAVIHVVATVLRAQYGNRWGALHSVPAKVTRKRVPDSELGESVFWAAFRINAREQEFEVPESLYVELEEGLEGILTYRGERLIRFAPLDAQGRPPDDTPGGSAWRPGPHLPRSR